MDEKQTEDELLGLDTSDPSNDSKLDKTENVDDLEAELLLLSSTVDAKPKEQSTNASDSDNQVTPESELSGDKPLEEAESKGKSPDTEVQDDQTTKEQTSKDADLDLLLDDNSHDTRDEVLDDDDVLNKTDSTEKSCHLTDEIESPGKSKPSIVVEEEDKTQAEQKSASSIKKQVQSSDLSLEILEEDTSNMKCDSIMEVTDDDEDEPAPSATKRKYSDGGYSADPSAVEIIDDDDYDDDELEILGESDADSDMISEEGNSFCEGKICIFWSHGSLFVWNAEDAQMLREECRIVGKLTGCLPRAPRQNNHLGLPLQLMPEEAKLLVDIDAAVVVEEEVVSAKTWKSRERGFKSVREDNVKLQIKMYKESRKEEVTQKMGDIIAGKKAKRQKLEKSKQKQEDVNRSEENKTEATDPDTSGDSLQIQTDHTDEKTEKSEKKSGESASEPGEENANITIDSDASEPEDSLTVEDVMKGDTETSAKHTLLQIFTENPWKRNYSPATSFQFPATERDFLRYAVFKDLWKKGYFLTSGVKFGGDFLVYPGDPSRYHSHYIAVCLRHQKEVPALDVVSMGRLSSNVRKTTLLCSVAQRKKKVLYTSLRWTGIS